MNSEITPEAVRAALDELRDVVRCRCHEGFTGRGLRDPDCQCDSADAVETVATAYLAMAEENERLRAELIACRGTFTLSEKEERK